MSLETIETFEKWYHGGPWHNCIYISKAQDRFQILAYQRTIPLFCYCCKKQQSDLFAWRGTRYGQPHIHKCEFCGSELWVTDRDWQGTYLWVNDVEIKFDDLYLIDWKYVESLGTEKMEQIKEQLLALDEIVVPIPKFCDIIEEVMGVKDYPIHKYIVNGIYRRMPEDILRWFSLLEALGVRLPEYVQRNDWDKQTSCCDGNYK